MLRKGCVGRREQTPQPQKQHNHSFEKYNLKKYNPDDSESEVYAQIDFKRRRKESLDKIQSDLTKRESQTVQRRNQILKKNRIKITGDAPPLMSNFTKMMVSIDRELIMNIKKKGYDRPTPIQMAAIPIILAKKNLIALAPTGSGKTAAFAIPILQTLQKHKPGGARCLLFAPSFELGSQLDKEIKFLNATDLKIKFMHNINRDKLAFKQQWQHIDILVCTPLKFLKLHQAVDLSSLEYVVMDESDKYFELGLLKQVQQMLKIFEPISHITYLFFSATLPEPVEDLFKEIMVDCTKVQVGGRNHVLKNIDQKLRYCTNEYGKTYEIKTLINEGGLTPPVLIFVQSKSRAEALYHELVSLKMHTQLRVECIHGCKDSAEREEIVQQFAKGTVWVLICTDLMARGIDFKGVKLVINYDFPNSMINYVHRVGRTGRAGCPGKAITLFTDEDRPLLRSLANILKVSGCEVPEWILTLPLCSKSDKKRLTKFPVKREEIETVS